ncbi:hypothetical protein [Oceanivirga salmonicida]|uniref:hypothetical protein n=1 Tax=Oceanivirga salmonicida TaxID=1769291 RepID=UPI00082C17C2|nr:hypothetical protein [Oceanivirga salmonicida]
MNKYKFLFSIIFLSFMLLGLSFYNNAKNRLKFKKNDFIYGITINDSYDENIEIDEIVNAIKDMPVVPTVRIVMSYDIEPEEYLEVFKKIHSVAYVMAEPVDSYVMNKYTNVKDYIKRYEKSYEILSPYVDIWEIGNEINGDWLGDNQKLIVNKMIAAYNFIREKGAVTALTSYYIVPDKNENKMLDWLEKHVPKNMKDGLDYLFVSYYEDDNNGYNPNWEKIFLEVSERFPKQKIGIGECGISNNNSSLEEKLKIINKYYGMPVYTKNFVGGYFWWYWVDDSIPHENNRIYNEINNLFSKFNK